MNLKLLLHMLNSTVLRKSIKSPTFFSSLLKTWWYCNKGFMKRAGRIKNRRHFKHPALHESQSLSLHPHEASLTNSCWNSHVLQCLPNHTKYTFTLLPVQTVLHYTGIHFTTATCYPAECKSTVEIALFAAVLYYHTWLDLATLILKQWHWLQLLLLKY